MLKINQNNSVQVDGQALFYDLYPQGSEKVVVVAHGFFNSKDALLLKELAEGLAGQGYDVAVLDFRGHGKSGGVFYWTSKEYLDLEAVLEELKPKYLKIGVIGFSLGAATSIITASRSRSIDSLISVSAPTEFEKIEYRFWELDVENDIVYSLIGEGKIGKGVRPGPFWLKKEKPIEVVSKVTAPTLFIHGERDWLIKPKHSQELFDKAQCPKKLALIKDGPHAEYLIRKNKDETISLINSWFQETL